MLFTSDRSRVSFVGKGVLILATSAVPIYAVPEPPTYQPYAVYTNQNRTVGTSNVLRVGNELWRTGVSAGTTYAFRSSDSGLTWWTSGGAKPDITEAYNLFSTTRTSNYPGVQLYDGRVAFAQPMADGLGNVGINYHVSQSPVTTAPPASTTPGTIAFQPTVTALSHPSAYTPEVWDLFQLRSGRTLIAYNQRRGTLDANNDQSETRIAWSDNATGASSTWQHSDAIRTAVPAGWNGNNDGAVNPSVVQLDYNNTTNTDTKVWMMTRSQTGRLSHWNSADGGESWTAGAPSGTPTPQFYTTTGTASLSRMFDDAASASAVAQPNPGLSLIWSNGTMPKRAKNTLGNDAIWYAGRDALHAAYSPDNGQTWRGFREIYLDPRRELTPLADDQGTAQAFGAAAPGGYVVAKTGNKAGLTMVRVQNEWLLETDRSDDIATPDALNAVDNWSLWTDFGPVSRGNDVEYDDGIPGNPPTYVPGVKRDRYRGTAVVSGVSGASGNVLKIQKDHADRAGSGAVWNFPNTKRGRTSARVQLKSDSGGVYVALTDRFFSPTDDQGHDKAYLRLDIAPDGTIANSGGAQLSLNTWHDLTIDWNLDASKNPTQRAVVRLGGQQIGLIDARTLDGDGQTIEPWAGLSYLRFRSQRTAADAAIDTAGFLIDSVHHDGSKIRDAQRINATTLNLALTTSASWNRMRFDTFVPNPQTLPTGGGTVATFTATAASPYTGFHSGGAVPIVVETSSGTLTFTDLTSSQITSDIRGGQSGETITLRFVNPTNAALPATVSGIALRLGSVAADNVTVRLYDLEGNELPDWVFTTLADGVSTAIGYRSTEDLVSASAIHRIELTGAGADAWVIGSFNQDSATTSDLAYTGLKYGAALNLVPEPATLAAAAMFAPIFLRRRRMA